MRSVGVDEMSGVKDRPQETVRERDTKGTVRLERIS